MQLITDLLQTFLACVLMPANKAQLTIYYFVWIVGFLAINVIWDCATDKTPSFHLEMLKDKLDVLSDGISFSSALLILTGLLNEAVQKLTNDLTLPLIIAGFYGVVRSLPSLQPYKNPYTKQFFKRNDDGTYDLFGDAGPMHGSKKREGKVVPAGVPAE